MPPVGVTVSAAPGPPEGLRVAYPARALAPGPRASNRPGVTPRLDMLQLSSRPTATRSQHARAGLGCHGHGPPPAARPRRDGIMFECAPSPPTCRESHAGSAVHAGGGSALGRHGRRHCDSEGRRRPRPWRQTRTRARRELSLRARMRPARRHHHHHGVMTWSAAPRARRRLAGRSPGHSTAAATSFLPAEEESARDSRARRRAGRPGLDLDSPARAGKVASQGRHMSGQPRLRADFPSCGLEPPPSSARRDAPLPTLPSGPVSQRWPGNNGHRHCCGTCGWGIRVAKKQGFEMKSRTDDKISDSVTPNFIFIFPVSSQELLVNEPPSMPHIHQHSLISPRSRAGGRMSAVRTFLSDAAKARELLCSATRLVKIMRI